MRKNDFGKAGDTNGPSFIDVVAQTGIEAYAEFTFSHGFFFALAKTIKLLPTFKLLNQSNLQGSDHLIPQPR